MSTLKFCVVCFRSTDARNDVIYLSLLISKTAEICVGLKCFQLLNRLIIAGCKTPLTQYVFQFEYTAGIYFSRLRQGL